MPPSPVAATVRSPSATCDRGWREHAQAGGADGEFDARSGGVNLTVGVDEPGPRTLDDKALRLQSQHAGGPTEGTGEEPREERKRIQDRDGWHRSQIEQSVIHPRARSNQRLVAVLVAVPNGQGEDLGRNSAALAFDPAGLRDIAAPQPDAGGEIAEEAPSGQLVELAETSASKPSPAAVKKG